MTEKTHIAKTEESQVEKAVQVRPADPGSPTANQIWIKTSTNELKYYDGAAVNTLVSSNQGVTGLLGNTGLVGISYTGPQGATGPAGVNGQTGPQGVTGPQGLVGPSIVGPQGVTGQFATGPQGVTGPAGIPGAAGATGVAGASGTQGVTGLQGPQGATGPFGQTGPQGFTGLQGQKGATGPSQGAQGTTGLIGATGLPGGATGAGGITGAAGITGAVGPRGTTGLAGLVGSTGVVGPTGAAGPVGPQGQTGVIGPAGVQGPTGPFGLPGLTGEFGPTGLQGLTGANGLTGLRGLTGLVGPTGAQGLTGLGAQGPTGFQGVTGAGGGPKGDTGLQGITGPIGTQGRPGLQGGQGPTGPAGVTGPYGGEQGVTGLLGFTGLMGDTGLPGPTGPAAGPQGDTGLKGPTGFQGPTGYGVTGSAGSTGIGGLQGIQGHTGTKGITGLQGVTGPGSGAPGATGIQGPTGPFGNTGIAGPTGVSYVNFDVQAVTLYPYNILTTDFQKILLIDTTAPRTLNLPAAASPIFFFVKDRSGLAATNNITVVPQPGQTIDGVAANKVIKSAADSTGFIFDGVSAWYTIIDPSAGTAASTPVSYPYTVSFADEKKVVLVNSSSPRTITLPNAATHPIWLYIKDATGSAATNNITIVPSGGNTVDGAASFVINKNADSYLFVSNGSNGWLSVYAKYPLATATVPGTVLLTYGGYTKFVGTGYYASLAAALAASSSGDSILILESYSTSVTETVTLSDIKISFMPNVTVTVTNAVSAIDIQGDRVVLERPRYAFTASNPSIIETAIKVSGSQCYIDEFRLTAPAPILSSAVKLAGSLTNATGAYKPSLEGVFLVAVEDSGSDNSYTVRGVSSVWQFKELATRNDVGLISTIGLDQSNFAWCWGNPNSGMGGDGTTIARSSPVSVLGGRQFREVKVSLATAFALDFSGYAWAWGFGGTAGDGTTNDKSSPVSVIGGKRFFQLENIGSTIIALDMSSYAWAWGLNNSGQAGDNTTANKSSPVSVVGGKQFKKLFSATGTGSGCIFALDASDYLWAWGGGGLGNLGDGTTSNKSSPVSVLGNRRFQKVVMSQGIPSVLALDFSGYLWSWGSNSLGPLGDGTTVDKSSPVSVLGGRIYSDIFASNAALYAANASGLWAWGQNPLGNLGDNTTTSKSSPISVLGGRIFTNLASNNAGGGEMLLALDSSGKLWSWGNNFSGMLGDGTTISKSSPISVKATQSFVKIYTQGGSVSYALQDNGFVWAWGSSAFGALGSITTRVSRSSPIVIYNKNL